MTYRLGPIFWGLVLIGFGLLFLANVLSAGAFDVGEFLGRWWPLLLVLLGLWLVVQAVVERRWWATRVTGRTGGTAGAWSAGASETLSLDLAGATSAQVEVGFGAGELVLGRAPAGKLVEGTFDGGGGVPRSVAPGTSASAARCRPGAGAPAAGCTAGASA